MVAFLQRSTMNRAASRLISFRSKACLQNVIQRHLRHPSAAAVSDVSFAQLVKTVPEPRMTSQFNAAEKPKQYFSTLPVQKPRCNAGEIMKRYSTDATDGRFPQGGSGLSGFDQSEIVKIHTLRPDASDNSDYSDYSDGYSKNPDIGVFEDDYDVDDAFDDDSDDGDFDGDDFDQDEKIRE